jgi:hypothetical protein
VVNSIGVHFEKGKQTTDDTDHTDRGDFRQKVRVVPGMAGRGTFVSDFNL